MTDPTRQGAFHLLRAVLHRRQTLDQALDTLPPFSDRDRAAAHRLAAAVLRRHGSLTAVLEGHLRRAPPPDVMLILLIGAAGLLLLGAPPHAAVSTAVALARDQGFAPFAGLVNAVLRRVAAEGPAALAALDGPRLDTPLWLWRSWGAQARVIAAAHAVEAPLDLSMRQGFAAPPDGIVLPTGTVRLPPGTGVTGLPGYQTGAFWVQDAAAALPVRLLAPHPGEQIADLCAAPGGKTAQLADSGAHVTALDRDPVRLRRLRENLDRLGLQATLIHADAADWTPPDSALFDAVLLDAPCSATGAIRRHPDIVHLKRSEDVAALAQMQKRLLAAAAALLRPGGRLIYAVCSLQPEEGPDHGRDVPPGLRHSPFSADELPALPEALMPDGTLRTHPGLWAAQGGMDGFFVARFVRVDS